MRCSVSIPAMIAAEEITLKLSGLEIVLLLSPKVLVQLDGSHGHMLVWLQLPGLVVSRLARSSLRLMVATGGSLVGVWVSPTPGLHMWSGLVHRRVAGFQEEVSLENQAEVVLPSLTWSQKSRRLVCTTCHALTRFKRRACRPA